MRSDQLQEDFEGYYAHLKECREKRTVALSLGVWRVQRDTRLQAKEAMRAVFQARDVAQIKARRGKY